VNSYRVEKIGETRRGVYRLDYGLTVIIWQGECETVLLVVDHSPRQLGMALDGDAQHPEVIPTIWEKFAPVPNQR